MQPQNLTWISIWQKISLIFLFLCQNKCGFLFSKYVQFCFGQHKLVFRYNSIPLLDLIQGHGQCRINKCIYPNWQCKGGVFFGRKCIVLVHGLFICSFFFGKSICFVFCLFILNVVQYTYFCMHAETKTQHLKTIYWEIYYSAFV